MNGVFWFGNLIPGKWWFVWLNVVLAFLHFLLYFSFQEFQPISLLSYIVKALWGPSAYFTCWHGKLSLCLFFISFSYFLPNRFLRWKLSVIDCCPGSLFGLKSSCRNSQNFKGNLPLKIQRILVKILIKLKPATPVSLNWRPLKR